jgi:hypothetical protein
MTRLIPRNLLELRSRIADKLIIVVARDQLRVGARRNGLVRLGQVRWTPRRRRDWLAGLVVAARHDRRLDVGQPERNPEPPTAIAQARFAPIDRLPDDSLALGVVLLLDLLDQLFREAGFLARRGGDNGYPGQETAQPPKAADHPGPQVVEQARSIFLWIALQPEVAFVQAHPEHVTAQVVLALGPARQHGSLESSRIAVEAAYLPAETKRGADEETAVELPEEYPKTAKVRAEKPAAWAGCRWADQIQKRAE